MDINKALAELRAAFPRVRWVLRPTCVSAYRDDGNLLLLVAPQDDSWIANCATGWVSAQAPNPVSAVRAWLAAQPTAVFYSEFSSGKTMEIRGVAVVQGESWSLAGWNGGNLSNMQAAAWDGMNPAPKDEAFAPIYYPVVIPVPLPVDPPVLVGKVEP